MRVYRFEDDKGRGPYIDNNDFDHILNPMFTRHNNDLLNHPVGWADKLDRYENDIVRQFGNNKRFGFHNSEIINDWFNQDDKAMLKKTGAFFVSCYEVSKDSVAVGLSGKQCVFNADEAVLIHKQIFN